MFGQAVAKLIAPRLLPTVQSLWRKPAFSRNISTDATLSAIFSDPLPPHVARHTIFSGIQPTGIPHLGNYLGALQQWLKLQNEAPISARTLYSIVDLHAITTRQDPNSLARWRKEMLASLLGIGLNPDRSIIFYQSSVKAHCELMWILNCNSSMGNLSRMTQWKSKAQVSDDEVISAIKEKELKLGLFSYPVLQAADVLLYQTTHVPVGEDQSQHLEFTRTCANVFNDTFDTKQHASEASHVPPVFIPPKTVLSPAKRVMSLTNPLKKMSKSDLSLNSRILITDSQSNIIKKLRTAVTDSENRVSYDPIKRPGVSNLVDLLFYLEAESQGAASPSAVAEDCQNLSLKALKERVADATNKHLSPIRERYIEIMDQDANGNPYLDAVAAEGARKASTIANKTMEHVYQVTGLWQPQ